MYRETCIKSRETCIVAREVCRERAARRADFRLFCLAQTYGTHKIASLLGAESFPERDPFQEGRALYLSRWRIEIKIELLEGDADDTADTGNCCVPCRCRYLGLC